MKKTKPNNLRLINNGLSVVAVLLSLYIIFLPFLPYLWWWANQIVNKPDPSAVTVSDNSITSTKDRILPGTWLDIPRLKMHQQIHTGLSISDLSKGVWHIPKTSTPDKGGNTVVAGHRFTYISPQGVFYFLDKVQKNDRITVQWMGTEYTYKVSNILVVSPTEDSIQAQTDKPRFTLYTCTPLLTAKDRLVVQADLISKRSP